MVNVRRVRNDFALQNARFHYCRSTGILGRDTLTLLNVS